MRFSRLAIRSLLMLGLLATGVIERATAGEPVVGEADPSAADFQLQQYVYIDFPRQLQSLDNETALAERFVALQQQRVNSYRPFRSFRQYGATYFADQTAQLQLLAAQQELACLYQQKADMWRERQAIVQTLIAPSDADGN